MRSQARAELLIADSEADANLFYATQFLVPDPVLFIRIRGKKHLILNDLEIDRGKKEAQVDAVHSLTEITEVLKKNKKDRPTAIDILEWFLRQHKIGELIVPKSFPAFTAFELQKRRFKIEFRPDPFWKERLHKTLQEKEAIKASLQATGNAIREAYRVLKESTVEKNKILYNGKALTSEVLRGVIDQFLLQRGYLAKHTIVAGGEHAVDPHDRGSGALLAHWPIVMDVFPRSNKTQYYADMTRTVVKGKPSSTVQEMWHAVKDAQEWAIGQIRHGVNGKKIHLGILDRFEEKGFKTGPANGRMQGFFHGTGHGLGLEIHEAPRISKMGEVLKEGMVVTVEPGLYYQGTGGIRIEDVVYVTKDGCEVLSSCPKILKV